MSHIPVLLQETLRILNINSGEKVLDCTFGGGGHSVALLENYDCYVCGMDRDPDAQKRATIVKNQYKKRFDFVLSNFSNITESTKCFGKFDGVLFDFGVSSYQIDEANRGFSFSKCGKLDMRMSKSGISAYEIVNSFSEDDIANIIWTYGEESKSRKIAAEIVKARKIKSIETTTELANIVRSVYSLPSGIKKHSKIDAATKTFQAIRILVNDELREIDTALKELPGIVNENARIVTISFHALECRVIKNWAKSRKDCVFPINKLAIKPKKNEILSNPRSKSAILRSFVYNSIGEISLMEEQ
jgi:16S rRNA (cytosine1402-N4)-methyltransferase